MEFTQSTILAIEFILQCLRPNGRRQDDSYLPEPSWCNFHWFHKIQPGKIRQVGYRVDEGLVVVERDIEFYLLRDRVAIITVHGHRPSGTRRRDATTAWTVSRVRYRRYWHSRPAEFETEWVDRPLPVGGHTLISMPSHLVA